MRAQEEIALLQKRINELEKQLDNLRLSRRVLMDLLEQVEKEKNLLSSQLQKVKKSKKHQKGLIKKSFSPQFEVYELKDYIREKT
ncbi:MAG TPA: hypothetical protein GXX46_02565 [Peptococcaceae bacterium]|nr:hypothetical protein [Peptococcaceae bacterium]